MQSRYIAKQFNFILKMVMKNSSINKLFIIFSLIIVTNSYPQIEDNPEIQFAYSVSEGRDVYKAGDKAGYQILVYFDGLAERYTRYYSNKKSLDKIGQLTADKLNQLIMLINRYGFMNYEVGKIDPRNLVGPATNYFIGYRPTQESEMKTFRIFGGVRSNNMYPAGYQSFNREFKEILLSIF
jgi:hypothetical protein